MIKDQSNKETLERIGREELAHYKLWSGITGRISSLTKWKVWIYVFIAKVFGLTSGIKLMEKGEEKAEQVYS